MTPGKWVGTWRERLPDVALELVHVTALDGGDILRSGAADAGLVRLPVDRAELSIIPLYTEVPVVVVPADHEITAFADVAVADLADEIVLHPLDDLLGWDRLPGKPAAERPATTGDAVELVAAGIGVLVVPQSLARLHHRRDVTYRPLTDGPGSQVALAWVEERTTDLVEELVGIVRGRTARSSRGRVPRPPEPEVAQGTAGAKGGAKGAAGSKAGGVKSGDRRKPTPRVPGDERARSPRGASGGRAKPAARRGKPGPRGSR
ncbi:LysR family transcriptional regulator [Cellulomonas sp. WB94]|nr:LysR family transcriptional regulator [Cellulomonas sp. WB94]